MKDANEDLQTKLMFVAIAVAVVGILVSIALPSSGVSDALLKERMLKDLNGVFAGSYKCAYDTDNKPVSDDDPSAFGTFQLSLVSKFQQSSLDLSGTYTVLRSGKVWERRIQEQVGIKRRLELPLLNKRNDEIATEEVIVVEFPRLRKTTLQIKRAERQCRWITQDRIDAP